jgi:hypothetical protein
MWAKIENGAVTAYPYGPSELRRDNPNTSFPSEMSAGFLDGWGIVPVIPRNPPKHDYIAQDCVRVKPTMIGEEWVETWSVHPASPQIVAERTAEKALQIRTQRNAMLAACDWTQLPDAPVNQAEWAAYRQYLRSIPEQDGFPSSIIWPKQPE